VPYGLYSPPTKLGKVTNPTVNNHYPDQPTANEGDISQIELEDRLNVRFENRFGELICLTHKYAIDPKGLSTHLKGHKIKDCSTCYHCFYAKSERSL
jgi:hypothetical protein